MSILMLILIVVLAWLLRRPILRRVGSFLVTSEGNPEVADVIVLMNGNISTRPFLASDLCKKAGLPIVFARLADTQEVRMGVIPNISAATRELLIESGVPEDHVHLLDSDRWVASTWEEALLVCDFMEKNGYRHGMIVSDAFHTRRARWIFRKLMPDDEYSFECVATPFSKKLSGHWWCSEYAMIQVFQEYVKFLHYQWRWHFANRQRRPVVSDLPLADDIRPLVIGKNSKR